MGVKPSLGLNYSKPSAEIIKRSKMCGSFLNKFLDGFSIYFDVKSCEANQTLHTSKLEM